MKNLLCFQINILLNSSDAGLNSSWAHCFMAEQAGNIANIYTFTLWNKHFLSEDSFFLNHLLYYGRIFIDTLIIYSVSKRSSCHKIALATGMQMTHYQIIKHVWCHLFSCWRSTFLSPFLCLLGVVLLS